MELILILRNIKGAYSAPFTYILTLIYPLEKNVSTKQKPNHKVRNLNNRHLANISTFQIP